MNVNVESLSHSYRWKGLQRRIGITGGIATGKSSIGEYIEQTKGIKIIDADKLAHQTLEAGQLAHKKIINRYGKKIISSQNNNLIDRVELSKIIFNNLEEKKWVENLIHPLVLKKIENEFSKRKKEALIITIIPLLFEANLSYLFSEVWVVDCDEYHQLNRLVKRDKICKEEARLKISSQFSMETKKNLADFIIYNNGDKNCWESVIASKLG